MQGKDHNSSSNSNINNQSEKKANQLNAYARFSAIGFQMIVIIGLGVFAGVKLDEWYPNKYRLFTIILSLLAIALALYSVIRQVKDFTNNQKDSND
ncbi:MAG: AtpZ/AtpI family protein [Aquaticitalea sp.]